MSRAGGRRAPRTGLKACYDLPALPCPKLLVVSHRESEFSARFYFFFRIPPRLHATIRRNVTFANSLSAFPRNFREPK